MSEARPLRQLGDTLCDRPPSSIRRVKCVKLFVPQPFSTHHLIDADPHNDHSRHTLKPEEQSLAPSATHIHMCAGQCTRWNELESGTANVFTDQHSAPFLASRSNKTSESLLVAHCEIRTTILCNDAYRNRTDTEPTRPTRLLSSLLT